MFYFHFAIGGAPEHKVEAGEGGAVEGITPNNLPDRYS